MNGGTARRTAVVAAALVTVLFGLPGPAHGDPAFEPITVEVTSPTPGVPDPNDPPPIVSPDPSVLTLAVPPSHPWMLFSAGERPALRSRVIGAPPGSVIAQARDSLLATANDPAFTDRGGYVAGLTSPGSHRWGRDDLALVAFAWQITGEDRYLQAARLLLTYAVGAAPDYGAPVEPGVDEYYIQRAHRLNGFALAYDLLQADLPLSEQLQLRDIVAQLGRQQFAHASGAAWWGSLSFGSNIGHNNTGALGTAGLALWHDLPEARAWVLRSEQLMRSAFVAGYDPAGAGIEGVLYSNYGMRIPTFFAEALTRSGRPGLFTHPGIARQQEWFAMSVLPGGGAVNPLNDCRYYEINPVFTTWSIARGTTPGLSRWLFDNMIRKVPPGGSAGEPIPTMLWYEPSMPADDPTVHLPLAGRYRMRGLVEARSGWDLGDLESSFEARQNGWGEGVHQNQDIGQVTLYAHGAKLVVDSRYANWLEKTASQDPEAARSSESEAHNVVVADGRSQDFFGTGRLVGAATTARLGAPGSVDVAYADARTAWLTDQPQRADRTWLHVRSRGTGVDKTPAYVVVADRFTQGGGDHTYTSYLHSDWRNTATVDPSDPGLVHVDSGEVPGVAMDVTVTASEPVSTAIGSFTPDDAQDWARLPVPPGKKAQPRIQVTTHGPSHEAIQVLAPSAPGAPAPVVERRTADGGIASRVLVRPGVVDTLVLGTGPEGTPVSADGVATDGTFASVRRAADGRVESLTLVHGTYLDVNGVRLVHVLDGPATIAADGTTTDVDGEADPIVITPPPVIPESPMTPLLLIAATLVAFANAARRRRAQ